MSRDDSFGGHPFPPGTTLLGRYEYLRVLGAGAMGQVLDVRDLRSGQRYALKRIPPELVRSPAQMHAVRANFNLVQGLTHPHIAVTRFLEPDESTGQVYVLMDLVRGRDLQTWLEERRGRQADPGAPLPLPVALGIAEQAASALDYAHAKPIFAPDGSIGRYGVLHRDLKPANLMVVDGHEYRPGVPYVLLVDFGLAAEIQASMLSSTMHIDGVNLLCGSPLYMAPEQWAGRTLTRAIDQWALAVMLYEMVEGGPPFPGPTREELRAQVLSGAPMPPEILSPAQWEALRTALDKDRTKRHPSCTALVQAVAAAAGAPRGAPAAAPHGYSPYGASTHGSSAYGSSAYGSSARDASAPAEGGRSSSASGGAGNAGTLHPPGNASTVDWMNAAATTAPASGVHPPPERPAAPRRSEAAPLRKPSRGKMRIVGALVATATAAALVACGTYLFVGEPAYVPPRQWAVEGPDAGPQEQVGFRFNDPATPAVPPPVPPAAVPPGLVPPAPPPLDPLPIPAPEAEAAPPAPAAPAFDPQRPLVPAAMPAAAPPAAGYTPPPADFPPPAPAAFPAPAPAAPGDAAADPPDAAVRATFAAVAAGELDVAWGALPESWQRDVDGLIQEFGGKVDASLWYNGFEAFGGLVRVLKGKKAFVLGCNIVQQGTAAGGIPREKLEKNYDLFVKALDVLARSDLRRTSKLKKFSVKSFLKNTGSELLPTLKQLAAAVPEGAAGVADFERLGETNVDVLHREGDSAVLRIMPRGGETRSVDYVRIEGKWVPKKLADDWAGQMQRAKSELAQWRISDAQRSAAQQVIALVEEGTSALLAADNQAAFDQALADMVVKFGAAPSAAAPPAPLPPGFESVPAN